MTNKNFQRFTQQLSSGLVSRSGKNLPIASRGPKPKAGSVDAAHYAIHGTNMKQSKKNQQKGTARMWLAQLGDNGMSRGI